LLQLQTAVCFYSWVTTCYVSIDRFYYFCTLPRHSFFRWLLQYYFFPVSVISLLSYFESVWSFTSFLSLNVGLLGKKSRSTKITIMFPTLVHNSQKLVSPDFMEGGDWVYANSNPVMEIITSATVMMKNWGTILSCEILRMIFYEFERTVHRFLWYLPNVYFDISL